VTIQPGRTARQFWAAADEALPEAAFRTGEFAEAERLFGVGLVFQVLRRDWAAAMPYFWRPFGLAEAVEESGDLYLRSEIHRHLGFYYLVEDVRPYRQCGNWDTRSAFARSLAIRD
jgi:hypothetical protein